MQRRDVLKTAGGIGVGAAASGLGLLALTGSAAAQTSFVVNDPNVVTTDDGEIEFVSYGGLLQFEWDGADSEATHGQYETLSRIQKNDGSWTSWKSHGTDSGPLGDDTADTPSHDGNGEFEEGEKNTSATWGGDNDSNSPGTDGFFQFKFGFKHGQRNYAIVHDGNDSDLDIVEGRPAPHAIPNAWETSHFNVGDDGGKKATNMEIRMVCAVYDGEPGNGGTKLAEGSGTDSLTATVNNRVTNGTTTGQVDTHIGADES